MVLSDLCPQRRRLAIQEKRLDDSLALRRLRDWIGNFDHGARRVVQALNHGEPGPPPRKPGRQPAKRYKVIG